MTLHFLFQLFLLISLSKGNNRNEEDVSKVPFNRKGVMFEK